MPNILVRGHMRFESESVEDDKCLEEQILADKTQELKNELDNFIKNEIRLNKKIESLRRKLLIIGNRRAKRDSLVNAINVFEIDLALQRGKQWCAYFDDSSEEWVYANAQTEDEVVAEVRQQLLERMVTAQCLYPSINLERIFSK